MKTIMYVTMMKDKTYEMLQLPGSIPTGDETLCGPEIVVASLAVLL